MFNLKALPYKVFILLRIEPAQSSGTVEYIDSIPADW